ncbi:tRNA (adenosine(37)-N6)-threonylcarbamoyltransferase complex dimerization subunit type 1 TsaB [Salegentibacter sp. JZCK2]|uniref:tRNA (adenosine(37)-N6)-threonylcarbamoyltransferase complex dimerization subunit type 1 TsaB n=1 Tax=Salegentibacter tibetensis TaxID=2873600 RepID=UPI001CCD759C|nr:tRNA (adenosine(37)-N6)-threonylcarbamoyltransferase complex dimerization subunit type 1 TsaB [Salegentibacter tibetensis]MBZ9729537.1 tRNA (adenosine(37)-N6)-threonylcarbamoyltransferase complex dimerization subunit type 1 TsaB [Salegentibacter tibetensis]
MALILCLETATTNCSVALSQDGAIVALKEDKSNNYSHAEKLHVFIDEILKENNLSVADLNAIAVSKGPGSYTGLRIGVSTAKGLCFSLDIPLISIATLASLAAQIKLEKGFVIPMLDARRMEVYSAVFDKGLNEIRETKAEVLDKNSFAEFLEKDRTAFLGNGVEKFEAIFAHPNAEFITDKLPSAREMCSLAEAKYKISDTEDVAYFEPYYLKDFIAG